MRDHTRRISVLDVTFDVTTVWRSYNRQGYLERKLHLQWRSRGS